MLITLAKTLLLMLLGWWFVAPTSWSMNLRQTGPLRIGMSLPEVKKALADERAFLEWYDPDNQSGANGCAYLHSNALPKDVSVMFDRQRVVRIEAWEASSVKTASGIGIGATEDQVRAAYPGQIKVEQHPYTDGHYLIYTPTDPAQQAYGMIFETENKRVTSFRAGLSSAVSLIEGCS